MTVDEGATVGGSESSAAPVIECLVCGPLGNNVYVVADDRAGVAMVVDAGLDASKAVQTALREHGWRAVMIVATHSHWDHVAEIAGLAASTGAPVVAHELDAPALTRPTTPRLFPEMRVPPVAVARTVRDGDVVAVGRFELTVLHTPGHTPGSICLLWSPPDSAPATADASTEQAPNGADDRAAGVLLSGDTLFAGSYGRYDLPGGNAARLWDSLRRLAALPPATHVLPGHGDSTTIGAEGWLQGT